MKPLLVILTLVLAALVQAQTETYEWSNFSGKPGGSGSADGAGNDARFLGPSGVTFDRYGNMYIADSANHTIRKVTPGGVVSTMAGKAGVSGNADGIRDQARFYTPTDLAVDDKGNVFVTDFTNHLIRKITPDGVVSTYSGDRINGSGSTDGSLSIARFSAPAGIDIDIAGNLYIADSGNRTIRKITNLGIVSTPAGTEGYVSTYPVDGTGPAAVFNNPRDLVVAPDGVVFVSDANHGAIRKITPTGVVTTLPGYGFANFGQPYGIELDPAGNLYTADYLNHRILKITPAGAISTLAGGATGITGGHLDGPGTTARFSKPDGLAFDPNGNLIVADTLNQALRKVTPGGAVSTPLGAPPTAAMVNGIFSDARYSRPNALAAFGSSIFVADTDNSVIRKITANGNASTFAGTAEVTGKVIGAVGTGKFKYPEGLTVDASGNLYVADTGNHSIRKTNTSGVISDVAGGIFPGSANGSLGNASFRSPSRLDIDGANTIYVADRGNVCIRKITTTLVSTLAGNTVAAYADGTGTAASFSFPNGLTLGTDGNLRLTDTGNHAIRQITPGAVVTTLAGGSVVPLLFTPISGTADGTGIAAQFNGPFDLSYDADGNLIVVDTASHTIRKITPAGVVTTIGGTPGVVGGAGGIGPAGLFSSPRGVATIGSDIYISDTGNNRIMKGIKRGFRPMLDRSEITVLGNDTATLVGTVNPNGSTTTARFEYGIGTSLGSFMDVTLSPGAGLATQGVSATLTGLAPGTAYFYRLSATNAVGTSSTRMGHFITPTPIIEVESPNTRKAGGITTLSFNPADIQQAVSQTLFVKNPGNVALAVHSIIAMGANMQDFEIDAPSTASVAPGASAAVGITFRPTAKGSRRALMRVTSNDPAKPVLDVALAGTGLTLSESWRNLYFQQIENTGDAADLADPDKDGVNNLLERAFNLNPTQNGINPLQTGTGTSGMPVTSLVAERLRIEYIRRKGNLNPGMIYQPIFSSQLDSPNSWSPTSRLETTSPIDEKWERVIAEDDLSGVPNRFARIRVTPVE